MKQLARKETLSHSSYQMAHIGAQAEVLRKFADKIKLLKESTRIVLSTKEDSTKKQPKQSIR